jgi:hypothetical protein
MAKNVSGQKVDASTQETRAHPKIMLIDCPTNMRAALSKDGHNVSTGSFGRRYKVPNDGNWRPALSVDVELHGFPEQEIFVIDLTDPPSGNAPSFASIGVGKRELWVRCTSEILDPRPQIMAVFRDKFERVLAHGGQFIIFATARDGEAYQPGFIPYRGGELESAGPKEFHDNWSFLSWLDERFLSITFDSGSEITSSDADDSLVRLLSRHLKDATFDCVLKPTQLLGDGWFTLAQNKYGGAVAGVIRHKSQGTILVVPNLTDKSAFIKALLKDELPQLNPALFPEFEGMRWVHRPEYEVPLVLQLRAQLEELKRKAAEQTQQLTEQIAEAEAQNRDWYTLLTGTGDELVEAVIRVLEKMGFEKVLNVDKLNENKPAGKREDVQIHDRSPVLVVDIKGVNGHPADDEATQSEKHALMRLREWIKEDKDVQPLTIINHQRPKPPHSRDQQAYRDEIVQNALHSKLGLMTTWDLWKIAKNAEQLGWPIEAVKSIFYRVGRIEPIPDHYEEIGSIAFVWRDAFGVVSTRDIHRGARLAIEVGDSFIETNANSLQVDKQGVDVAVAGSNCGISFLSTDTKLKVGARVFLVRE